MLFYSLHFHNRCVNSNLVNLAKPVQLLGWRADELRVTGELDFQAPPYRFLRRWLEQMRFQAYGTGAPESRLEISRSSVNPTGLFLQLQLVSVNDVPIICQRIEQTVALYTEETTATWKNQKNT